MLLIVIVFSTTFVLRDIMTTPAILSESNVIMRLTSTSTTFRNIFLGTLCVGVIFKIISLTFFIVVLNYGRKQLSGNNTSSTTSFTKDNSITFNMYITLFITSTIAMGLLVAMIFMLYASYESRVAIINVAAFLLSFTIIGSCAYEMIYASKFFNIFKYKGVVYQTTT